MNGSQNLEHIYSKLYSKYESSNSEAELRELGVVFNSLSEQKEFKKMALQCFKKAENCRKKAIYDKAMEYYYKDTFDTYNRAISEFYSIHPYKDTGKKIKECNDRLFKIKSKNQKKLFEREQEIKNANKGDFSDTSKIIFIGMIVAFIAAIVIYIWNLLPN